VAKSRRKPGFSLAVPPRFEGRAERPKRPRQLDIAVCGDSRRSQVDRTTGA